MTNSGSFFIIEPTCKIEAKSADCSASTDVVVIPPTKLPVELKVMNLSSNKVIQFNAKNMKRYKQLNRLYLKNVYFENNEITSNQNWFVDLISLEELDMTGTDFRIDGDKNPYTLNCRWPARLKKLILSDMGIDNIAHLSSLKELEYLDVSKNYFAVFPAIDSNAPLKYLILAKNPLANITISHVAAFCELISLDLQSMILHPTFGSFMSPSQSCSCNLLKQWMKEYGIANEVNVMCAPLNPKCKLEYDIGSKTARNDCLGELPSTSVFELLLYAVLFSILFPILYFVSEAWNSFQGRFSHVSHDSNPAPRRRKRSSDVDHKKDAHASDDSFHSEYESFYEKYPDENKKSPRPH